MDSYAILFLCLHICLVQNVVTQYLGNYGPPSIGIGYTDLASSNSNTGCNRPESYGGLGKGNVAVTGELPVVGSTAVIAQVPVFGGVSYGGALPAAGTVFISDNCVCTCGGIPVEF